MSSSALNAGDVATVLELDIEEIDNAIKHLKRSNDELRAFAEESPEDAEEFMTVVAENEVAIETKLLRKEELNQRILRANATSTHQTADTNTQTDRPEQHATVPVEAPPQSTTAEAERGTDNDVVVESSDTGLTL
jgi:hypothetical protein